MMLIRSNYVFLPKRQYLFSKNVNLSNFIAANDDIIDQVEMTPILVKENEVVALDALIIKK